MYTPMSQEQVSKLEHKTPSSMPTTELVECLLWKIEYAGLRGCPDEQLFALWQAMMHDGE